jgi:hypothetical protein
VAAQAGGREEGLTTGGAGVGSLAGVLAHVAHQRALVAEHHGAQAAGKLLPLHVHLRGFYNNNNGPATIILGSTLTKNHLPLVFLSSIYHPSPRLLFVEASLGSFPPGFCAKRPTTFNNSLLGMEFGSPQPLSHPLF